MSEKTSKLFKIAVEMGVHVDIKPGPFYITGMPGVFAAAAFNPEKREIYISGSLDDRQFDEALAHEIGHAQQYDELVDVLSFYSTDPVTYFKYEMDACDRGEKMGIDMSENRRINYNGYAEHLGLFEMGLA